MRRLFLCMLLVLLVLISGCFKRDLPESEFQVSSDSNILLYVDVLEVSAITNKGMVVLDNFEISTIELTDGLNNFLKQIWASVGDTLYKVKLITGDATCSIDYVEYPCTVSGNNINVMIDPFQMEDLTNVFYEFDIKLMKRGGRNPFFMLNPVIRVTGYFINNPPLIPDSPIPYDGATDTPLRPTLYWNCQDPDGGELSYDVYLSEPNDSSVFIKLTADHKTNNFELETDLQNTSTYYWKVVAKDSFGASTEGPLWSFTTSEIVVPEGSFLLKFSIGQPSQAGFALQEDSELSLVYTNIDLEDCYGRLVLSEGVNTVQLDKGGTYVFGVTERSGGVINVLGLIGDAELGLHTLPVSYAANDIIDLGHLIQNGDLFTSELITGQDLCNLLGHSYETLAAFGMFDITLKKFLNPDINKNGLYDREEDPETNWTFAIVTDSKWFDPGDIDFDDIEDPIKIPIDEFTRFVIRYAIGLRNASCLPTMVETSVPGRLTLPNGLGQIEVPGGEREEGFHWEPFHWETGWGEVWFQLEEVGEMIPPFNGDYVLELGNDYESVYYFDNLDFLTPDDYLEGFIFAVSKSSAYPNGQLKSISWRWYRMQGDGSYVLATPYEAAMTSRRLYFFMHGKEPDGSENTGIQGVVTPEDFGYDSSVGATIPLTQYDSWLYVNDSGRYNHYQCSQEDRANNTYNFIFRADIIGEPRDPFPCDGCTGVSLTPTLSWETFTDGETLIYTVQISTSRDDFDSFIVFETTTNATSVAVPQEHILNLHPVYYWRVFPSMEDPLHPGETITYAFESPIWSFYPEYPGNYPPLTPFDPDPTDGATGISLNSTLRWRCFDYDGDILSFEVYLSDPNDIDSLAFIHENYNYDALSISEYVQLKTESKYYWKIVAKDGRDGVAESPVWSFTTLTSGEEVFFPDQALKQVVCEYIGKDPGETIYANEVLGIEGLHAEQRNISNLSGIEHLSNLRFLYINENDISDISPLASLTKLEYLNIETNNISDISILTQLPNLQGLSTGRNPIANLSVVNQIPNLNSLALVGLGLENSDILFLGENTKIQTIWLNQNNITDLTTLASMVYLNSLDFSNNLVADLSPLQNLSYLTGIWGYSNQITNIEPLQYLTNLSALFMGGNQITDLSPLASLNQITHLECSSNQIADISPLATLQNLQWMSVSNNDIQDILPLVNNTGIDSGDYVDISFNFLDLTPDGTDMTNITLLLERGVNLAYEPQK
ncbi:protein of unknown function [Mesotoga infera]|uniref:Fibronectin type-III domain-containing protein n=1 Tax=Mesotoga infera TaxID=1236046 RepID=A0A7Z7LFX7_9BACT|nr:leucine-rich repeat domain-containing protein [Mesotoga infera]SSC12657.1 protein of unknown function [Mesotoga infera]